VPVPAGTTSWLAVSASGLIIRMGDKVIKRAVLLKAAAQRLARRYLVIILLADPHVAGEISKKLDQTRGSLHSHE